MNELLQAATRFFLSAAAACDAYVAQSGVKTAPVEPPVAEPAKPRTRGRASSDDKNAPAPNPPVNVAVNQPNGPVAAAETAGNASAGTEKMTTETARPRVLAVAQKIGSPAVKAIIKKETGADALADVPAEKLPALVAVIEKAGADADV